MDSAAMEIIAGLAERLGTTGEHLWATLLTQARLSAVSDIVYFLVFGYALNYAFGLIRKYKNGAYEDGEDDEVYGLMSVLWLVVLLLYVFMLLASVNGIAAGIFNPDYWALDYVMGHLK